MILCDERVGSRELLQTIRGLGIDADLAHMDADFQFCGNGIDGSVLVGFERKTVQDLLNSMRDRRLAGTQVGKMLDAYDVCYLVVEGIWRRGRNSGLLEVWKSRKDGWQVARGNHRFSEVSRFLASLRELGGIRIWRTADEEETAAYVVEEYEWWQKEWKDHKTGQAIYAPGPDTRVKRLSHKPTMFRRAATLKEKWLFQLPRIDSKGIELGPHFESAGMMAHATVEEWMEIKGIGRKTAEAIVEEIWKET